MIPFSELKAWILAQPDDHHVDMEDNHADDKYCGCLLVQFARSNGYGGWIDAGMYRIHCGETTLVLEQWPTEELIASCTGRRQWTPPTTFSQAKAILAGMEVA